MGRMIWELRIGGQGAIKSTGKNDYSPAASKLWNCNVMFMPVTVNTTAGLCQLQQCDMYLCQSWLMYFTALLPFSHRSVSQN